MAIVNFVKGENVTVRLNSVVLGGINKAVCTHNKEFEYVKQFLSDVPVNKVQSDTYKIELTMSAQAENSIANTDDFELEFEYADGVEVFDNCNVKQICRTVNAKGIAEDVVMINAEKRNVK